MVRIITVNFEPLLRVFVKYMLQFDKFFAKKSTMNTKGISLLPRGNQSNINYRPQSSDSVLGFWPVIHVTLTSSWQQWHSFGIHCRLFFQKNSSNLSMYFTTTMCARFLTNFCQTIKKTCQITTSNFKKLTVMIITINFEPSLGN